MKQVITSVFLFSGISAFAQKDILAVALEKGLKPIKAHIQTLESENSKRQSEVVNLHFKLSDAKKGIDFSKNQIQTNSFAIDQSSQAFGLKISKTKTKANKKKHKNLFWRIIIWGTIGMLSFTLLLWLVYRLLGKEAMFDEITMPIIFFSEWLGATLSGCIPGILSILLVVWLVKKCFN